MRIIGDAPLSDKILQVLHEGEEPLFAVQAAYLKRLKVYNSPTILVSSSRVVVIVEGLFGAKVRYESTLGQIGKVEYGLWNGGGPQLAIYIHTRQDVDPIEIIIRNPVDGEIFARELQKAVSR